MANNPNNCATCQHYQQRKSEGGHCYMFADSPTERCYQHTYLNEQEVKLGYLLHNLFQRAPRSSDIKDD